MKAVLCILVAAMAASCRPPAPDHSAKLAEIAARLESLDERQAAEERRTSEIQESLRQLTAQLREVAELAARRPPPSPSGPRPGAPDPAEVYSVPIDGSPVRGHNGAKVTLVMAAEYACPFCVRVRPTIELLEKKYGRDLRVVYKHYVVHPQTATVSAHAACAAHQQNKFWQFDAALIAKAWDFEGPKFRDATALTRDGVVRVARGLRLDMRRFEADLDSDACKAQVAGDLSTMAKVGTRGTPAFYINGRFLSGAQPIERFEVIIDEELQKAKTAIAGGVKPEDYYQKAVVEGGRAATTP